MPEPGPMRMQQAPGLQNEKGELAFAFQGLAEWTGLEPATPGVTGRYSNQLNYHSLVLRVKFRWWVLRGSNPRHSPCKGDALPTELSTHCLDRIQLRTNTVLNEFRLPRLLLQRR
jgi:hypothetical protein